MSENILGSSWLEIWARIYDTWRIHFQKLETELWAAEDNKKAKEERPKGAHWRGSTSTRDQRKTSQGWRQHQKPCYPTLRVHQTVSTTPPRRKGGVFPALSVGFTCNPAVTQRVHWAP